PLADGRRRARTGEKNHGPGQADGKTPAQVDLLTMSRKNLLLVLGSVAVGLILGLAIRRARMPAPLDPVAARAALPSKERVGAALLRAEIRELDARMAALQDEQRRLDADLQRLAFLTAPPRALSPEEQILQDARTAINDWSYNSRGEILVWLK